MEAEKQLAQASIKTSENLKSIALNVDIQALSRLSLPEIDAAVNLVGQIIPAGNVPGVILNGLARLPGRKPPANNVRRDINLIFKGLEQTLDKAVYGAFFAGPAAVIWGYQNILKLAGKDPDDSFPEGTWQFYVDYALREDTARHANETHGFDSTLMQHNIQLSTIDRITAWAMAAIHILHQYPDLLANEWRERVYTALLREVTKDQPDAAKYAKLYSEWEKQRPYARGRDATISDNYPRYRRLKFDQFITDATRNLSPHLLAQWQAQIRAHEAEALPAFQQQMNILAYLDPALHGENRTPYSFHQANIGIIHQGRYYLLPICAINSAEPGDVHVIRSQIATLIQYPANFPPTSLIPLAKMRRAWLADVRKKVNPALADELQELRFVPILFNADPRPRTLPLAQLRQAERGIGDHALTIFDTGESIVLDQSHIFFDGAWGAALAEIMTNEALAWAVYLMSLPPAKTDKVRPYAPELQLQPADQALIDAAPRITPEASAESEAVKIKSIMALRQVFKQRSDLLQLTINDLLILYRAIHGVTYQLPADLIAELKKARFEHLIPELQAQTNPAILIPVDASQRSPRDRLYPMNFEVPLDDLDLLSLHRRTLRALDIYESTPGGTRSVEYQQFDALQRQYLGTLAGFGQVLSRAKEIANTGESASVGTIKLLAHMPTPLQRLLDHVPGRFEVLNDIIKGREVFSNVGAVAKSSTLTRFISAKDDNEGKTLVWGAITDANGIMRLTLRDFRPHVSVLLQAGYAPLAQRLAQAYLDAYVQGINTYIYEVRRITLTSRETRMAKGELNEL